MGVVLDTHVLIWLFAGDQTLSEAARDAVKVAALEGDIFVPAISIWEVAILQSQGRIAFNEPLVDWINSMLNRPSISLAPLTPSIAIESCNLPGVLESADPADRIIVATARVLKSTLLTRDARILAYANAGFVSAIAA